MTREYKHYTRVIFLEPVPMQWGFKVSSKGMLAPFRSNGPYLPTGQIVLIPQDTPDHDAFFQHLDALKFKYSIENVVA
jgi:hypothetical protein